MKIEKFDRIGKGFQGLKKNLDSIYNYKSANFILYKYAFALPVVSKAKYAEFADVFCKLASNSNEISFNSLWIMTAKRNGVSQVSDRDLFDDISVSPLQIDKTSLNNLINTLGKVVKTQAAPSNIFLKNFSDFIAKKVKEYSFKDKEISQMQEVLNSEYANSKVSDSFKILAQDVKKIHSSKRIKEINELNNWAFKCNFTNDNLLKKLSFRSTYINLLYEAIIKENNIRDINIQEYYQQHRIKIGKQVAELTGSKDAKGKEIVRKYAINKVYKAVGAQDKFKHNAILHNLSKYQDYEFYEDTVNILEALDGGPKNRNLKQPLRMFRYER